jgi:hypothetical protein
MLGYAEFSMQLACALPQKFEEFVLIYCGADQMETLKVSDRPNQDGPPGEQSLRTIDSFMLPE